MLDKNKDLSGPVFGFVSGQTVNIIDCIIINTKVQLFKIQPSFLDCLAYRLSFKLRDRLIKTVQLIQAALELNQVDLNPFGPVSGRYNQSV